MEKLSLWLEGSEIDCFSKEWFLFEMTVYFYKLREICNSWLKLIEWHYSINLNIQFWK